MTIRQGGSGVALPYNQPYPTPYRGSASQTALLGAGPISLMNGQSIVLPAGNQLVSLGPYSFLQYKDPVLGVWRTIGGSPGGVRQVDSDGASWRVANLSGCAVGAFITNVGSGYTSAPTVTASAGGSTWTAIVGGAINTTVTVGTAGTGYTYAPIVVFSPPPAGGVQATGYATLSSDGVGSVVVVNQGAGYTSAPTISFIRDPRDTTGINAAATVNATLAGAGTITAVVCTNHGTVLTSVPTLTFSGGGGSSAAATVVMCFAATGFTVGNGGAAYGNAQPFLVQAAGGKVAGTAGSVVNPALDRNLFTPRPAIITGTSEAGGAITATGAVIADPGLFQAVPTGFVTASGTAALPTTTAIVTITVGGAVDTVFIQPY